VRANLIAWAPLIPPGALLVSLLKGIELGTRKRMSEVIIEVLDADAARSPWSPAEPGGRDRQAPVRRHLVACASESGALTLQRACHTPYFRPYTNSDVTGCELGGTGKNVIAIAVGIAGAMGLGDNTRAALITRGWPRSPGSVRRSAPSRRRSPACRDGRPRGHLQFAAVTQQDVREYLGAACRCPGDRRDEPDR